MIKKLVVFIVVLLLGLLFKSNAFAGAIMPGCWTGRGACGGGGGGEGSFFNINDQIKVCTSDQISKEDCLKIFCIEKKAGQGTYTQEEINRLCQILGFGAAKPSVKPSLQPTPIPSPILEPSLSPVPTIEASSQAQIAPNSYTWTNRIRNFFTNIFQFLFGKKQ